MTQCPSCKHTLIIKRPNGELVIRNNIIIVKSDGVWEICPFCRQEVKLEILAKTDSMVILNKDLVNYSLSKDKNFTG
jgi:uncharacterized protein YbaR (Trm112 family)